MPYSISETDGRRCPESRPNHERVDDPEKVARILHSANCDSQLPSERTFQLDELSLAPSRHGVPAIDHECGNSAGVSVQRTPPLTEQDLWEQSRSLAAAKPNRVPHGAALARVGD